MYSLSSFTCIHCHRQQAQEAQSDEYIKNLEAGVGVMPAAPIDVAAVNDDGDSLRLTAAVEAGLKQASQRVAASAENTTTNTSMIPAAEAGGMASPTSATTTSAASQPTTLLSPTAQDATSAESYPATLDRPEDPSTATQPSEAGYVVVSDPAGVEGGTVVQQVQSIAAAGVAQSRSAVRQLQEQLDARRQSG